MNKAKYKVIMPLEKIILYISIVSVGMLLTAISTIFFGTYKFLMLISRAQKQVLELQNKLVESAKEIVSLQNDLKLSKQLSQHNTCNCKEQLISNFLNEK